MGRSQWWPHTAFEQQLGETMAWHWRRALQLEFTGDTAGAIRQLRVVIEAHPRFVPAISKLGGMLAAIGHTGEADHYLQTAMGWDPFYPPAINNWANLKLLEQDIDGAIELYQAALRVDPSYALARRNLAIALRRKGDYSGFVREWKRFKRDQRSSPSPSTHVPAGGCVAQLALLPLALLRGWLT